MSPEELMVPFLKVLFHVIRAFMIRTLKIITRITEAKEWRVRVKIDIAMFRLESIFSLKTH